LGDNPLVTTTRVAANMSQASKIGRVWVFDPGALDKALARYQDAAVAAYPEREERIAIAVAAIRDFLYSEYADRLTMKPRSE
jgi:hypothetical protein